MAAMSAVVPLAQVVAGPLAVLAARSLAAVLAAVIGAAVHAAVIGPALLVAGSLAAMLVAGTLTAMLVAGTLTVVLVAGTLTVVLAAVSVAVVLVVGSLTAVLAVVAVAAVLVAGSLTVVLLKGTVSAVLVKGSVSGVLAAVFVAAVHVAVLVVVLSAMQVGRDVDLPFFFRPFPTLDGAAAVLPLPTVVLAEPLLAGVLAFSLWDVGNVFCFGGGGMSLASLLGKLAALLLGALQNPGIAGPTVPGDVVADVLGWDLERLALGDGSRGGVLADSVLAVLIHRARLLGQVRRWQHPLVYRPLVDLSTMEERHVILTYTLDRATIQELCAQLEPDLMSAICHPTGIPPLVQVLSVLHFLASDSGYPNLSWLLTPVRNPRSRAEERYNEAHGRTRRVVERTFSLLKARFPCLHMTGGSLYYSPKKVCQNIVASCMLHNLALRRQVPFLQEDGPEGGLVAAVEPVDSEEEEAEEEDIDNRTTVIQQYFQ
ncbi:hypothetical protein NDU88_003727 [Pleurodeles waltl]|uniref:DDE Tnp4 domain-containing protein n=1 Tax=Pleurodeles waltl TaxID=8319 RepID=A0AAV7VE75_PLEWA|nr:hypothetical protein NDU88_003727 [Pleurodeles waltl]